MIGRRTMLVASVIAAVAVFAWLLFIGLPRWYAPAGKGVASAAAAPAPPPVSTGRKIKARLFYVADDGLRLVGVERDVPYGEGTVQQAKEIVAAQLAPPPDTMLSAIPAGTALRALFVTPKGDAYIDLSGDVSTAHSGGSIDELLTVYAIVNAVTANLPAVSGVQLLVNGKEVETLAGHVDLRRPLAGNLSWVQ